MSTETYGEYRVRIREERKKKPRVFKDSNIWTYRAAAVQWLRYERQCPLVSIERAVNGPCNPDVLGCEKSRYLIEVEIKRTLPDFRANVGKESLKIRSLCHDVYVVPKLFYFLVAPEMVEIVVNELPVGAGLLSFDKPNHYSKLPGLMIVKRATADSAARRLKTKELRLMAAAQSGTLFSILKELHRHPELVPTESI